MCQEFLNLAHLHFHLFFKLNQKTFPSVNSREVSVQIPVKFGYDFTLGEKLHFIPSVGAYGRFSMVSIKENVTENAGENSGNSFKWNSFNNYQPLIPQHYSLTLFISAWATKSCPGFFHVRIFTYLSVAKRRQAKL